jgi:hypothetical protein
MPRGGVHEVAIHLEAVEVTTQPDPVTTGQPDLDLDANFLHRTPKQRAHMAGEAITFPRPM